METTKKVWIIGASGKHGQYGQYMVRHALDRGYEVVGVCWPQSAGKLDAFDGRIPLVPGRANDPTVIAEVVAGCDGALTVRVPRGVDRYATGTAQAVLGHAKPGARLTFSCGWPITIRTLPFRMRTRRERSGVSVRLSYAFRFPTRSRHAMLSALHERTTRFLPATDVLVLSLLVLCMTHIVVRYGLWTPVGGLALLAQAGLLGPVWVLV